ncbi:MAG: hypothetical protein AB2L14_00400 [Candidatus Xenobiia bacterium LiM19]
MKKRALPNRETAAAFIALFIIMLSGPAWSAAVSMKTYPAIGNFHKYRKTFPICVEISNSGHAFKGTIEINNTVNYRSRKDLVVKNVELPQNSLKQFFLYVPYFEVYNPTVKVELKSRGQTVIESKVTVDHIYPKDFLILTLSKEQAGFEYLANPKLKSIFGKDSQINITYPAPEHLPLNWAGYESADLMILSNYQILSLSPEQEKAIRDWVLSGGTLFISSGLTASEFSQSPFNEILPVTINDVKPLESTRSLEVWSGSRIMGSSEVLAVTATPKAGSQTLISADGRPLLVRKDYAMGTVYFFCCDITKPPFSTWQGNTELWGRIFKDMVTLRRGGAGGDDQLPPASMPQISPPSLRNLSFFLFLYIMVVGPINYLLLKKRDKMLLTFITVPIMAFLFTLCSFLYGYSTKGSSIIFRTLSICEMENNMENAPLTSFFSIFSPSLSKYEIEIKNPQSIAYEINPPESGDLVIEWKDGLKLKDINMDMWSMRRFKAREVVSFPGKISFAFDEDDGKLTGTVRNDTELLFQNCAVIYKNQVSGPFALKNGDNRLSLTLSSPMKSSSDMAFFFLKLYNLKPSEMQSDSRREQISFLLYFSSSYFARKDSDQPVIIGWTDRNISGVTLLKNTTRGTTNTLFIIK